MKRDIILIDEEKCTGCGLCVPNCHEGALQIIDGKARLISDLMCDGLGACIGHCPEDAITVENREAEPYDEIHVISGMVDKGKNTIVAHLQHLKDHKEFGFMKQGVRWLEENQDKYDFDIAEVKNMVHHNIKPEHSISKADFAEADQGSSCGGGCPGSAPMDFNIDQNAVEDAAAAPAGVQTKAPTELRQWPVQLHLLNPAASYIQGSDMLLAADCTAFTIGSFHQDLLKGKSLAIACPKLDSNQDVYLEKLSSMIDNAKINTLTVAIMEVPCCGGLIRMAKQAVAQSFRKIPIKEVVIGIQGDIISEQWV